MKILSLDWETKYSKEYTLKKLTSEAYVRDPRFEALCLGVSENGSKYYVRQEELKCFFGMVNWADTAVLHHHAHFDGLILSHHFGIHPAFFLDTLSMSRAVHGLNVRHSLAALAERYGLPEKTVPYNKFIGKGWVYMDEALRVELCEGAAHDAWLCEQIYYRMQDETPTPFSELFIIDQTIRMFTDGCLRGNADSFRSIANHERRRKKDLLKDLGVPREDLNSSAKFAALLNDLGVEVPYKPGKSGKLIPCVAKTDPFMKELLDDPDTYLRSLAEARLGIRSNIEEKRADRLAEMSNRGPLCVYLNYNGTHTTRWSGGDKLNFQNLPKDGGLRRNIEAPKGHVLIIVDFKQIEARLLNVCAGQDNVVDAFRDNRDLYCELASSIFSRIITKKDTEERQVGKVAELGAGYGMGWFKFKATLRSMTGSIIEDNVAQAAIKVYRSSHPNVVRLWKEGDNVLRLLADGPSAFDSTSWGVLEVKKGKLILPNGMPMHYELEYKDYGESAAWFMKTRIGWTKIWGGHLVENYIQGIARVALSDSLWACHVHSGGYLRAVLLAHDEAVFAVPLTQVDEMRAIVHECFSAPLAWLPEAPMDCDIFISERYEKL